MKLVQIIILNVQMRKIDHREIMQVVPGHMVGK